MTGARLGGLLLLAALACLAEPDAATATPAPAPGLASSLARPAVAPGGVSDPFERLTFAAGSGSLAGFEDPGMELLARRQTSPADSAAKAHPANVLTAERARTILRSLTVPGWGQATTGHPTAAKVFGIAELAIWTSYAAFRIQSEMRRESYEKTAQVLAGIDLNGRDEEFRRIVGSFISSDEYNQLVVYRDAANLFYDEHGNLVDPTGYQQYVAEHSLKGSDSWAWPDDGSLLRYRGQRKDTQRAALRANAALAMAVVNRLLSAIHAARLVPETAEHSWELPDAPGRAGPHRASSRSSDAVLAWRATA